MIHQRIYIEDYGNWLVDIYYGVTHFEVDEIMENLYDIGCDSMSARRAYDNITSGDLNTGLTYSNYAKKQSVIVIGVSENMEQFFNSLVHEFLHLTAHISTVFKLDMYSESVCYLIGSISQLAYKVASKFFCKCTHCKDKVINEIEQHHYHE